MTTFSNYLDKAELLRTSYEEVQRRIAEVYDQNTADFDGRRTDARDVARRNQLVMDMLEEVVSGA